MKRPFQPILKLYRRSKTEGINRNNWYIAYNWLDNSPKVDRAYCFYLSSGLILTLVKKKKHFQE